MCLIAQCFLSSQEQSFDNCLESWISAIESSKDHQSYPKAIEYYTSAIQSLDLNQPVVLLNLTHERGNVYLKMLDFNNAIQDFSFILNHPQVSREQKIEALWGRNKAYLAIGKIREFQEDCNQLDKLESSVTMIEDNKNYAIVKLAPYMIQDAKGQERFINLLMMRKEIKSQNDVTFTPSGLVVIKKNKTK